MFKVGPNQAGVLRHCHSYPNGPNGCPDTGLDESIGVANRRVLGSGIAVVNEPVQVGIGTCAVPQRHLQCIQHHSVVIKVAARQPTIIREKTSTAKAT